MTWKTMIRRVGTFTATAVLLVAVAPAWAADRKAVPRSGHGASPPTRSRVATQAPSPRSGTPARTPVQGRAHYGYGGSGYGGYPGHYPGWYGPLWSYGFWWGWPSAYWDPWWYPTPYVYVERDSAIPVGPALLETDVVPRKARVRLDGEDVGRVKDYNGTWDQLPLREGRHVVEFEADGYQTLRVVLDASAGRRYRVVYALQRGAGLDERSSPDPASLPPPEPAMAPAGVSAVETATAPGDLRLSIPTGFLKLEIAPPDASVYLDGEFFARAEEIARLHGAIPLVSGEHRLEVVRPGFADHEETLTIRPDEATAISVTLTRER